MPATSPPHWELRHKVFMESFGKSPRFIVHQGEPFNGGADAATLRQNFITPYPHFYVRSHAPQVPQIDPATYCLTVTGRVARALSLSLDDLRTRFTPRTVTATLQCAGNRRQEFAAVKPMPGESVMWGDEAISTAQWGGVALADVLEAAGVDRAAGHVAFLSLDACEAKDGTIFGYGGSIPLEKALRPEVLLAHTMNGEPLPAVHGYPLRVIVPGVVAARSVKWLGSITVQDTPSENHFQAQDYKLFPAHIDASTVDWSQGEMLNDLRSDAVICSPRPGATLPAGALTVEGYALPGGDAQITSVEVSVDDGVTWYTATLHGDPIPFTWRFWSLELALPAGAYALRARVHDTLGTRQADTARDIWNFRGYMNNAQHRVEITVS